MRWIPKVLFYLAVLFLVGIWIVPTVVNAVPREIPSLRQENSKTYKIGDLISTEYHMGPIHYKDDYSDPNETWKNIDTTIVDDRVTKAPFDLTIDPLNKSFSVRNKKTGEVSSIRLDALLYGKDDFEFPMSLDSPITKGNEITWKSIVPGVDLSIIVENDYIKFSRIISGPGLAEGARFTVEGQGFSYSAWDKEGMTVQVDSSKVGSELTEKFTAKEDQYPITIDPTYQVGATADDAGGRLTINQYWDTAWTVNPAGGDSPTQQYYSGMRFQNVAVANGADIYQAYITFTCGVLGWSGTGTRTRFSGDDVDSASAFSTEVDYTTRYNARTTAEVDWDSPTITAWVVDSEYQSPELKTIVQEIVDRGGWASGNNMAILWGDREDRSTHASGNRRYAYSWDSASTKAPVLTIIVLSTPTLVAVNATGITNFLATLGANVTSTGGINLTNRGFQWDIDSGVPYANNWTESGSFGTGVYTHQVTSLTPNTQYFFRGYGINPGFTGYSGESTFTTTQVQCLAPTNMTVVSLGGNLVGINWTKGTYSTDTLIVGKSGSYPQDREDGWVVYNGTASGATDARGIDFNLDNPFFRAWAWNTGGFSLTYAQATLGGGSMLLLGFIGLACFFTWLAYRRREILICMVSFLLWFAMGIWLFFSPDAVLDISEPYVQVLTWVFFIMSFVPLLLSMNTEITHEAKGKRWTTWGNPPKNTPNRRLDYQKMLRKMYRR